MIPSTSVAGPIETSVIFETSKVAVSSGPFGTVFGVQLVAMFQSPVTGFKPQVALPARAETMTEKGIRKKNIGLVFVGWFPGIEVRLWYNGEGQIIPVAAGVAGLKLSAVDNEDLAFRQVVERTGD